MVMAQRRGVAVAVILGREVVEDDVQMAITIRLCRTWFSCVLSRAIAGGETPDIGLTHEAAQGRLFVTEVDEVHRDDLVNDAG